MARTPVTTEVLEEAKALVAELPKIPVAKRTPVPVEEPSVEKMQVAAENGAMDAKPRHEVKPIIDGYRECARPDCTASFKPRSINPKDTEATEYYCSDDCAIHEFYRKRHLGPVPEKIVSGASQASNRAHKEERKRKRIEAAPEHDAKYGPMRKVVEVLGTTKTSRRVKLECGHTTTSRSDQQRCRHCRPGKEKKNDSERVGKGDVQSTRTGRARVQHLREGAEVRVRGKGHAYDADKRDTPPVKRQPVTRATVKKTKRTPVKPPTRGKKGTR